MIHSWFFWIPLITLLFFIFSSIIQSFFHFIWTNLAPKEERKDEKRCEKFCILGYKLTHHIFLTILMWNLRTFEWYHNSELMVSRLFIPREYPPYIRHIMLIHTSRYVYLTADIFIDVLIRKKSSFGDSDWIEMFLHHIMSLVGFVQGYHWYFFEALLRFYPSVAVSDAALSSGRLAMMMGWGHLTRIFAPFSFLAWFIRCLVLTQEVYLTEKALFGEKWEYFDFTMMTVVFQQWVGGITLQWIWLYRIGMGGLRLILGKKLKKGQDRNVT